MISKRIRQLRKEMGLTQAELGSKLGVINQTISSFETGVSIRMSNLAVSRQFLPPDKNTNMKRGVHYGICRRYEKAGRTPCWY